MIFSAIAIKFDSVKAVPLFFEPVLTLTMCNNVETRILVCRNSRSKAQLPACCVELCYLVGIHSHIESELSHDDGSGGGGENLIVVTC